MLIVSVGAIVAVIAAVGRFDFWTGLVVGVAVTALVSSTGWLALELAGARSFAIGGLAERWTADELGGLRRAGWTVLDDVPFNNCGNVDHVAIGPTGVFAVETKFTAVPWTIRNGVANVPLSAAIHSARERATKVANILNHLDRRSVRTVLVVWGPGAPELPNGFTELDDVLVCRGPRSAEWRRALVAGPALYDATRRREFADVIEDHVKRQEAATARV